MFALTDVRPRDDGIRVRDDAIAIRFAWWNTRLAPVNVAVSTRPDHAKAVEGVIDALIGAVGCNLVVLAEARRQRVLAWVPAPVRATWDVIADTSGARHDFDLAVLYDVRRLQIVRHRWVSTHFAGGYVRCGLLAEVEVVGFGERLLVAAAHWRSDAGNASDAMARRTNAAYALRGELVAMRDGREIPILLVGDFNAEPYDDVLQSTLRTARARDVVVAHRPRSNDDEIFYNAAWRWLGERDPWTPASRAPSIAGSYRLDQNLPSSWRTFDHVLVSRELLGANAWSLDESALGLWADELVYDRPRSRIRAPFDHLPITGHLVRGAKRDELA